MHLKTHLRISIVPAIAISTSVVALLAVFLVPRVRPMLAAYIDILPTMIIGVAGLLLVAFTLWYLASYAAVRRNMFTVRSIGAKQRVDLRRLVEVELFSKPGRGSKRREYDLVLRMQDSTGRQLFLPLNTWRDEDLLMARVLRATVDCRVKIEGDPQLVRRFGGLINSYKSWDHQQAAA